MFPPSIQLKDHARQKHTQQWYISTAEPMALLAFLQQIAVWAVVLLAGGLFFIYMCQESLLYHPSVMGLPRSTKHNPDARYKSPRYYNIDFETIFLRARDGVKLHSWLLLQPAATRGKDTPTVLFLHANAGNVGFRLPNAVGLYQQLRCNVFLLEYRGYGDSEGVPSEGGLVLDAQAALDWLMANAATVGGGPIIAFGRSLGGAVAVALAAKNPSTVAGLVVENTFLSISKMADSVFPVLSFFKGLVLRLSWDTAARIKDVVCPILFISGGRDELVPPFHMRELHRLAVHSARTEWHFVPTGTHNDSWLKGGERYNTAVSRFVQSLVVGRDGRQSYYGYATSSNQKVK